MFGCLRSPLAQCLQLARASSSLLLRCALLFQPQSAESCCPAIPCLQSHEALLGVLTMCVAGMMRGACNGYLRASDLPTAEDLEQVLLPQ